MGKLGPVLFGFVMIGVLAVIMLTRGGTAPTPAAFTGDAATMSLGEARERAGEQGRVVFAVATADWCGPCQTYKKGALADTRVEAWLNERAVPLILDVTDGMPPDAESLGVQTIPASFVIAPDGRVLASQAGAMSADQLLPWLEQAAGG
jgi:thiol:disulfide interchange protein